MIPGQWQIGSLTFGRGTIYPITSVQMQSYQMNAQDAQLIRSDDIQFGFDNMKPAPIIFEMGVLDFRRIENIQNLVGPKSFTPTPTTALDTLAQLWRGDGIRLSWGELIPLKMCDRNGTVKIYYGRPRKFEVKRGSWRDCYCTVTAEFQRADTFSYSDYELYAPMPYGSWNYINVPAAQANSWVRVVGTGPLTYPTFVVGPQYITLNMNVPAGQTVELNSYPWSRRAVLSTGANVSAKMNGYLDNFYLRSGQANQITWGSSVAQGSATLYWRDVYPT